MNHRDTRRDVCPHKYGEPVAMFSHKRKSSREFYPEKEGEFAEHQDVRKLLEIQADRALQGKQEALSQLSETEFHIKNLLEEQRSDTLRGKIRLLLQETRAEHPGNII